MSAGTLLPFGNAHVSGQPSPAHLLTHSPPNRPFVGFLRCCLDDADRPLHPLHQTGKLSPYVERRVLATVLGLVSVYGQRWPTTLEVRLPRWLPAVSFVSSLVSERKKDIPNWRNKNVVTRGPLCRVRLRECSCCLLCVG